ncbi:hypothetical protein WKV44_08155 [Spirochaetia bacterium 38H-sp]|uniref:Lipoprotein n=1 Tax=Rarispira pelagica TaxID=3141764 RepID=A0ABU9UCW5_9SPIR
MRHFFASSILLIFLFVSCSNLFSPLVPVDTVDEVIKRGGLSSLEEYLASERTLSYLASDDDEMSRLVSYLSGVLASGTDNEKQRAGVLLSYAKIYTTKAALVVNRFLTVMSSESMATMTGESFLQTALSGIPFSDKAEFVECADALETAASAYNIVGSLVDTTGKTWPSPYPLGEVAQNAIMSTFFLESADTSSDSSLDTTEKDALWSAYISSSYSTYSAVTPALSHTVITDPLYAILSAVGLDFLVGGA